jgi:hypothetical protein
MHPSTMVRCHNLGSYSSQFTPHDYVSVDAVSRKVVSATKVWVKPDSMSWAKDIDSVSRSLAAMGGTPYPCKFQPRLAPPSISIYRRVRGYFVSVTAFGSNYMDVTPYQINLTGQQDAPYECLHPPRMHDFSNVCAGATVRVPLPGNYEWCWKGPFDF